MGEVKEVGTAYDVVKAMKLYAESIASDIEASATKLHEAVASGDMKRIEEAYNDMIRNVMDFAMWANIWSVTQKFLIYTGDLKVADREAVETAVLMGMVDALKDQFDEALKMMVKEKKEG